MRRIVVTLDTGSLSQTAIEAAAGLASGMSAQLVAMFVEDVNLLRLAGLPFARETGRASARVRALQATDMERALLAQGRLLRQSLENAARQLPFAWSLEIVRGDLLDIALSQAGADMLVLGCTRRPGYAGGGHAARPKWPASRGARRIMVVFDGSEAALRALEAAHALARTSRSSLIVLARDGGGERAAALRAQAVAWLAAKGDVEASFISTPGSDIASLASAARMQEVAAVLLPAAEGRPEAAHFAGLVDEIACPVVLIR